MRAPIPLLFVLLLAVGCTGEREASATQPAPSTGGMGDAVVPAPRGPPPAAAPSSRPGPTPDLEAIRQAIYNRVLGRLKAPEGFDEGALRDALEERTGARVLEIRPGPMGLVSVGFEPTDPPRDAEAQRALVEAVGTLEDFAYAEPERLMKAQ
jgi:hypothetical protein